MFFTLLLHFSPSICYVLFGLKNKKFKKKEGKSMFGFLHKNDKKKEKSFSYFIFEKLFMFTFLKSKEK